MSYDLVFWREIHGLATPKGDIYRQVLRSHAVEGLADLPLNAMLASLLEEFPAAVREPNGPGEWVCWESANQNAGFQVEWSNQAFIASCRRVHTDDMNRLIDWAARFDCPLYDPQTNERFG